MRPAEGISARAAYEAALRGSTASRPRWKARCPSRRGSTSRRSPRRAGLEHHAGRVRRDGRAGEGVHRRGRRLPGGAVAALRGAVHPAGLRALSLAPPHEPGAVPLLPRFRRLPDRLLVAGDSGAGARGRRDDPAHRRHPPPGRDAGRGPGPRGGTARRSQGACRAPDAPRSRPQRCGPRLADRHRARHRSVLHRALQPGDAHRVERGGRPRHAARSPRRAHRRLSGGHRLRRAEGAGHGDHRRVGEAEARALCRLHRLFRRGRRDGHLHRAPHRRGEGRADARPGGRGHRLRFRPGSEQQECVNKAKALFRAAEEAVRFAAQARRGQ